MMTTHRWISLSIPLLVSAAVCKAAAADAPAPAEASRFSVDSSIDASYTARSETRFRGANSGRSDAFSLGVGVRGDWKCSDAWSVPVGILWQGSYLDDVAAAPVPDRIQTLRLSSGVSHKLNDEWRISAVLSPSLYKLEDIGSNDIGLSAGINAIWRYSPTLTLAFGLLVSPDSEIPVIPMAGLVWRMDDQYTLDLIFPKPRITYRPGGNWSLYAGADLQMTTFRTSDTLGTSRALPGYNDALGSYRDIRLGAGVGYRLNSWLNAEAEVGYSVDRQIDYTRIDEKVRFGRAPYVRAGLSARF